MSSALHLCLLNRYRIDGPNYTGSIRIHDDSSDLVFTPLPTERHQALTNLIRPLFVIAGILTYNNDLSSREKIENCFDTAAREMEQLVHNLEKLAALDSEKLAAHDDLEDPSQLFLSANTCFRTILCLASIKHANQTATADFTNSEKWINTMNTAIDHINSAFGRFIPLLSQYFVKFRQAFNGLDSDFTRDLEQLKLLEAPTQEFCCTFVPAIKDSHWGDMNPLAYARSMKKPIKIAYAVLPDDHHVLIAIGFHSDEHNEILKAALRENLPDLWKERHSVLDNWQVLTNGEFGGGLLTVPQETGGRFIITEKSRSLNKRGIPREIHTEIIAEIQLIDDFESYNN